jgi:long-chain fatty acid transport protein
MTLSLAGTAQAGGLAVREQSAQFQGSSFAGTAAGGGLSSSFWNSAAIGEAGNGFTSESHAALIMGRTDFDALPGTSPFLLGRDGSVTNDLPAFVPSSYYAYRVNQDLVFGLAINSPFGLSTKLDNSASAFAFHHRKASLLTMNANPMVSYRVRPGLHLAVGAQIEYAKLRFATATNPFVASGGPSAVIKGDDIGFGFTAGLLWKPQQGTSIGLGYRSSISHTVKGDQFIVGGPINSNMSLAIETPEIVTLSLRQTITPKTRLLGTVEWTHWDRLDVHPIQLNGATIGTFDFQWSDGWIFSVGGEYDYSDKLTLRTGVAYEISPIDDPTKRLAQTPDSDRIWVSVGATYKYSDAMSFDVGYSHVFFDDTTMNRQPANGAPLPLIAQVDSSADIVSVSLKTKW